MGEYTDENVTAYLANFLYKGPEGKYFRPCGLYSLLELLFSVATKHLLV